MGEDSIQAVIEIANQITMVGLALLWIRAERTDNLALWRIIERLTDSGIRTLDKKTDDID